MKELFQTVLLGLLLIQNVQFAQGDIKGSVVAWVGEEAITTDDFIERYELNPHINSINKRTSYFSKLNFLHTLIAYKLWYQNKNEIGVTESLAYNTAKGEIKKLYVRDALYRKNVLNKINLTSGEIEEALKKQKQNLDVEYVFVENEKKAYEIFNLLKKGFPLNAIYEGENSKVIPVEIKYGDYNEYIENQLYELKIDDYSKPLKIKDGYYIFHLKNIVNEIWKGNKNKEQNIESVKKILIKRKEIEIYNNYMRSVLNGLQANVDKKLFNKLAVEINKIYSNNFSKHKEDKEDFHLTNNEFVGLESKFNEFELRSSFISLPQDTITLKKYLRAFFFNGIKLPNSNMADIHPILDSYVRDFIIKEQLFLKGKEECLDTLSEVIKYENMWAEYYAFETAKGGMLDAENVPSSKIQDTVDSEQILESGANLEGTNGSKIVDDNFASKKVKLQIINKTNAFAENTSITINYDVLKSIEVTKINSFTIRHMGFGGSITGAPIYAPNYEWTWKYNTKFDNLP